MKLSATGMPCSICCCCNNYYSNNYFILLLFPPEMGVGNKWSGEAEWQNKKQTR